MMRVHATSSMHMVLLCFLSPSVLSICRIVSLCSNTFRIRSGALAFVINVVQALENSAC